MKIGILNTGNVGSRLARAWAHARHDLVLAKDGEDRKVAAGPLKSARQLEQLGVLLHHVADHEYGGNADLVRLALSIVEASPGPIIREQVA